MGDGPRNSSPPRQPHGSRQTVDVVDERGDIANMSVFVNKTAG